MTHWIGAAPPLLLALSLLAGPGLVVARCLRFRWWDAIALSVPLSLGVAGFANWVSAEAKIAWGLPVLAATAVAIASTCFAVSFIRGRRRLGRDAAPRLLEPGWTRNQHRIAAVATVGAAVVGGAAIARGIGGPEVLNQTFDGAFHVNAIDTVARLHLATPNAMANLTYPHRGSGFYPPTFAAIGGLVSGYGGVGAIAAANITAVAIAMLWPVSASIAVRRLVHTTAFGYGVAMSGAVTVGLFPALLMRFGTLWPNALSYLALAPALVVLVRLGGLDRATHDGEVPHGRLDLTGCLIAGAIAVPGLIYAHPGVIFMLIYLAVPFCVWLGWRRYAVAPVVLPRRRVLRGSAVVIVVVAIFVVLVKALYRVPGIASVSRQYWPPIEAWDQAIGQTLLLSSGLSSPNIAMGVLACAGLVVALRQSAGRYLVACYLVIAGMSVLSAGIENEYTMQWTGFWYNDPSRILATLPVIALPLIALGADYLRERCADQISRASHAGLIRRPITTRLRFVGRLSLGGSAGAVVVVMVLILQGGMGTSRVSQTVAQVYGHGQYVLVNADMEEMIKRVGSKVPVGKTIAGNPFQGEILAQVITGVPTVYRTFGPPTDADRALVGTSFNTFASRPDVCAAVKRLKIGVVIVGDPFYLENVNRHRWYKGFDFLDLTPGLTKIDSGGNASAYLVGDCSTK